MIEKGVNMLYETKGDIVTGNFNFFVQQVNCKGVMGAGLAKQIRDKYPAVYYDYINAIKYENATLGHVLLSPANGRICVCLFSQYGYGRDKRYTDYEAFSKCLTALQRMISDYPAEYTIAFPYGIGCGLAGGDWNIIRPMLEQFSENVKQKVYIVMK